MSVTTVSTPATSPTSAVTSSTGRDRAILAAAAAGRCVVTTGGAPTLLVDGRCCADQFAAHRLTAAGWIRPAAPGPRTPTVPVTLTPAGTAVLRGDRTTATRRPAHGRPA